MWTLSHQLSVVRLTVLSIWLVLLLLTPFGAYSTLPPRAIEGYGLGRILIENEAIRTLVLKSTVLEVARWGAITLCVVTILLPGRRWLLVSVFALVLLLDAITKAIGGYVNHAQFLPLYCLAVLAVAGRIPSLTLRQCVMDGICKWRRDRTFDTTATAYSAGAMPAADQGHAMSLLWLMSLGFIIPYTFAGLNRLIEGGVTLFLNQSLLINVQTACESRPTIVCKTLVSWALVPWVATGLKLGFLMATLLELSAAMVWTGLAARRSWLLAITVFHLFTWSVMNIFFWENLLLMWAVLPVVSDLRDTLPLVRPDNPP